MMKSHFSCVVALVVLVWASLPSWAQPTVTAPKPPASLANSNLDALALVGAYYSKTRNAKDCRARLISTKSILKDGEVMSTETVEVQSSWVGFSQLTGEVSKGISNIIYSTKVGDKKTTEKLSILNDGKKDYRFYETRNSWSERAEGVSETPYVLSLMRLPWTFALSDFALGKELEVERRIVDGHEQISVKGTLGNEYIFDAKTGNLLFWRSTNENGVTEVSYLETEFDVPLEASLFQWKVPENAKQVRAESMLLLLPF